MRTLYLDNHLLVVDKPAGLLSQSDSTGDPDLVTQAKAFLKERFDKPGNVFAGLVHRLDRPTSGVIVLARTSKAAARLSEQFRTRGPEKTYLAIIDGHLGDTGGWVEHEDGIVPKEGGGVAVVPLGSTGSQPGRLRVRTLANEHGRSLVEVELLTGRKHQIRAQLAAAGCPVWGDFRYGRPTRFGDGHGIALHALRLAIDHPTQRDRRVFAAPPPASWRGTFDRAVADAVRAGLAS